MDHFYTPSPIELPNMAFRTHLANIPRKIAFSLHHNLAARLLGGYSLLVLAR